MCLWLAEFFAYVREYALRRKRAEEEVIEMTPASIAAAAKARIEAAAEAIANTMECVEDGRPLDAEPLRERKVARIVSFAKVDEETASRIADNEAPAALGLKGESLGRAEALWGKTVDYLGVADTEPGASGSPVFNDQWQVVALHHWGSPHREVSVKGKRLDSAANEGIRISAIVADLKKKASAMTGAQKAMLREAMNAPPGSDFGTRLIGGKTNGAQAIVGDTMLEMQLWQDFPKQAGASEAGGAPASRIDRQYANRRGYNPRFLRDFPVPLPQLNAAQRAVAARVRGMGRSANPYELRYQHFSVVLRADRRMAFFSACNIDGAKRFRVDRITGQARSGPEATKTWATDPRLPEEAQLSDAFYDRLRRDLRVGDFFARGHLTRREDPNWGTEDAAERANNDTYHHRNACPQAQNAFNGSQKVWQGIENFILNSADDSNLRVTVMTGPVFGEDDPAYEDEEFGEVRLPRRFWKIVAYVEDGVRKVFAVLADQSEVMERLVGGAPEAAFAWPRNLSQEYKSTVEEIEALTGLDFGDLAKYDLFAGGLPESLAERRISGPESILRIPSEDHFGRFASIGEFLERWEEQGRAAVVAEGGGAKKRGLKAPVSRERWIVEIEAEVARVFGDDLGGAQHQHFAVIVTRRIKADAKVAREVQEALKSGREIRLALRFGDGLGLSDRIAGIRSGMKLRVQGEWISAEEALGAGGERIAVVHFAHDPLGFVCTPGGCYS